MDFKEKLQLDNEKYISAFRQYGRSPKSLLWGTDRRNIRYYELLKQFDLSSESTLLDVGCGFADLYTFCNKYFSVTLNYTGIDYCIEFIRSIKEGGVSNYKLIQGEFLSVHDLKNYDYCVSSGIFNISNNDNKQEKYEFLYNIVKKMFDLCNIAIAFNFVTDKVEYKKPGVSYYSPTKVLDFCYTLSRNIVFDNSCMPFEATITIFKDDSFTEERIFNLFKRNHIKEFQQGIFIVR